MDIYPFFLQPILQLIFHEVPSIDQLNERGYLSDHGGSGGGDDDDNYNANGNYDDEDDHTGETAQPAFLNVSIKPVECSVMCPRHLADLYFAPLVEQFNKAHISSKSRVSISKDDYIAMQVIGEGLEAGRRVLELTSPLAMAGM